METKRPAGNWSPSILMVDYGMTERVVRCGPNDFTRIADFPTLWFHYLKSY